MSKHQALGASLAKAESKLQNWKREAKQEAKVAQLAAMAVGKAKARAVDELTRA